MTEEKQPSLLVGAPRVLDLTDATGFLCGRILADLGADVVKVEPVGGDPSRSTGPFLGDRPHREASLNWLALNANKRGITLNLETEDGRSVFRRLSQKADFVIESYPPGYLDALGLGYSTLQELSPAIILTSITPFGQTGPYRDYLASDLTSVALSGWMYLCGDSDRPPVRVSLPQACLNAGEEAALASLIAYWDREMTGLGQHVDVSILESNVMNASNAPSLWELNGIVMKRVGPFRTGLSAPVKTRWTWQCQDGYVAFTLMAGLAGAATNRNLVQWMREEDMADSYLLKMDWEAWDMAEASESEIQRLEDAIARFFKAHAKLELYEGAIKRRVMLMPVNTAGDILCSPQLASRGFWQDVEHPELGLSLRYPGVPFKARSCAGEDLSQGIVMRAPRLGEHNLEVYHGELGIGQDELLSLKTRGVV